MKREQHGFIGPLAFGIHRFQQILLRDLRPSTLDDAARHIALGHLEDLDAGLCPRMPDWAILAAKIQRLQFHLHKHEMKIRRGRAIPGENPPDLRVLGRRDTPPGIP
jgi:hypothetical protein